VGVKKVDAALGFLLRFDNISEAFDAYYCLHGIPNRTFNIRFADAEMYHTIPDYETPLWVPQEAELVVRLTFKNSACITAFGHEPHRFSQLAQDTVLHELQSTVGGIWHIEESFDPNAHPGRSEYRIEMDSVSMADKAVRLYRHGVTIQRFLEHKLVVSSKIPMVDRR
jgi:hypothetical protein